MMSGKVQKAEETLL